MADICASRMSQGEAVDADTAAVGLLKKLTLQLPGVGKRNTPSNSSFQTMKVIDDPDKQGMSTPSTFSGFNGKEQANSGEEPMPEWYEELDDDQSSAFKELFDMLDSSNTGILNADSLYEGLRRVDSGITRHDVETVINKLDDDGNGEIDFNEFLFHMSQIDMATMYGREDNLADVEDVLRYSKRQRLFYSAITRFSLKNALDGIERSYLAHMHKPHVLSHFTAAERVYGLTDRQLASELKRMQRNVNKRDRNSPYAKPMMFVESPKTNGKPLKVKKGKKLYQRRELKLNVFSTQPEIKPQENIEQEVKNSLRKMAAKENVVAKLPDIHLVAEINHTAFSEKLKQKGLALQASIQKDIPMETENPTHVEAHSQHSFHNSTQFTNSKSTSSKIALKERKCSKENSKRAKTIITKVENTKVPLPVLKIKYKSKRPTIEDLPNIREKANQAINDYYENLRKTAVQNAWEHWNDIYADKINPKEILENFRIAYRAYSPHKEEEVFVVCPWIPGPFSPVRSIKHTQSQGSRFEKILKIGLNKSSLRSPRAFRYQNYSDSRPNSALS